MRAVLIISFLFISIFGFAQNDSLVLKNNGFVDHLGIQFKCGSSQHRYVGTAHHFNEGKSKSKLAYEINIDYDLSYRCLLEIGYRSSEVEQKVNFPTSIFIDGSRVYEDSDTYASTFNEIPFSVTLKLFPIKKYSSISVFSGYSLGWLHSEKNLPSIFEYARRENLHALHLGARASIKLRQRFYLNADLRRTSVLTDLNRYTTKRSQLIIDNFTIGFGYKFGQCD